MGERTHVLVALHAHEQLKRQQDFKISEQSNTLAGDKAAGKTTRLSIIYFWAVRSRMNLLFRATLFTFIFVLACPSCVSYHPITHASSKPIHVQFDEVKNEDGVDEKEAVVLAEIYYVCTNGECGGIDQIRRRGNVWEIGTLDGPRGVPGEDIVVDARTGTVCQKGKRTVRFPWDEFRDVLRANSN